MANEKVEPQQIAEDMQKVLEVAEILEQPSQREVLRQFVDCVQQYQQLATLVEDTTRAAEAALDKKPKDEAKLAEYKSTLEKAVRDATELEQKTLPEIIRQLQESTQDEKAKVALGKMADTLGKGPMASGVAAAGEETPEEGDGGASLWDE